MKKGKRKQTITNTNNVQNHTHLMVVQKVDKKAAGKVVMKVDKRAVVKAVMKVAKWVD